MAGPDSKSDPAIPFTDFKKAGRKAENPLSHPEEGEGELARCQNPGAFTGLRRL